MARGRKTGGRKAGTPNKATAEIRSIAQQHGTGAIEKLTWLMNNADNDTTQLMACKEILDRAYGKPGAGPPLIGLADGVALFGSNVDFPANSWLQPGSGGA